MESMSRRGFVAGAAAMGVMGASAALAEELPGMKTDSPENAIDAAPGVMTQTLDELNAMRQAHIDAAK